MRTTILASSAAALALAAGADAADFTLRGFGGATYGDWEESDLDNDEPAVDLGEGSILGVAAGVDFGRFVLEVEYASREADGSDALNEVTADIETILVNGWYEHPFTDHLRGYIGGGTGEVTSGHWVVNGVKLGAESGLAWQLGTGLRVDLGDTVWLGAGYRRFWADEVFGDEYHDSSVIAEIGFTF